MNGKVFLSKNGKKRFLRKATILNKCSFVNANDTQVIFLTTIRTAGKRLTTTIRTAGRVLNNYKSRISH